MSLNMEDSNPAKPLSFLQLDEFLSQSFFPVINVVAVLPNTDCCNDGSSATSFCAGSVRQGTGTTFLLLYLLTVIYDLGVV